MCIGLLWVGNGLCVVQTLAPALPRKAVMPGANKRRLLCARSGHWTVHLAEALARLVHMLIRTACATFVTLDRFRRQPGHPDLIAALKLPFIVVWTFAGSQQIGCIRYARNVPERHTGFGKNVRPVPCDIEF